MRYLQFGLLLFGLPFTARSFDIAFFFCNEDEVIEAEVIMNLPEAVIDYKNV